MRNEIIDKVEIFLQSLRCEDGNRETLVHLDSCKVECKRLEKLKEDYKKVENKLGIDDRVVLEK